MGVGRINRLTYWLAVLVLLVICYGISLATQKPFQATPFLLAILAVPRLHDFGKSGWWAAGMVVLEIATGVALALKPALMTVGLQAIALLTLVVIVLAGVWPGNAGANRFAPAPGGGIGYSAPQKRA